MYFLNTRNIKNDEFSFVDCQYITKQKDDLLKRENLNSTRINFAKRLQRVIDKYNSGGMNTGNYDELVNFAENIHSEDERNIREGLTKDELELLK